jgi:hypothetical protein
VVPKSFITEGPYDGVFVLPCPEGQGGRNEKSQWAGHVMGNAQCLRWKRKGSGMVLARKRKKKERKTLQIYNITQFYFLY